MGQPLCGLPRFRFRFRTMQTKITTKQKKSKEWDVSIFCVNVLGHGEVGGEGRGEGREGGRMYRTGFRYVQIVK